MLLLLALPAHATVVDATRTLVPTSSEVIAMGSAGIGFAEGATGLYFHPGAPGVRAVDSTSRFHLSAGLDAQALGASTDLTNNGGTTSIGGTLTNAGLVLGYDDYGVGLVGSGLSYAEGGLQVGLSEWHLAFGASVYDRRLTVGIGYRLLTLDAVSAEGAASWFGQGIEGGVLATGIPGGLNAGVVVRQAVVADPVTSTLEVPVDGAVVPWQLAVGAGWASEGSPLAGRIVPVRVVADLVVDTRVAEGATLESLLTGDPVPRGRTVTLSPRLGLEVEPWRDRLRLRGGTWLEPTRTPASHDRGHATSGLELRLFRLHPFHDLIDIDVSWQVAVDVAPRYVSVGWLGIGSWGAGRVGYRPPTDGAGLPPG